MKPLATVPFELQGLVSRGLCGFPLKGSRRPPGDGPWFSFRRPAVDGYLLNHTIISPLFSLPSLAGNFLRLGFLLVLTAVPCHGAATLTQEINPTEANVGDTVSVTIRVQNGGINNTIQLPHVDGLEVTGNKTESGITFDNGSFSSTMAQTFFIIAGRTGDFVIPGFDLHTQDGQILRVQPMKLHIVSTGATNSTAPAISILPPAAPTVPSPNGPVVQPPANPPPQNNPADGIGTNITVPLDKDGQPAKVFLIIAPKTTDAYVGETVPLQIEFYIRLDAMAGQDSLPTIKGSDFLMNNLSVHPFQDDVTLNGNVNENMAYHRYKWVTTISAAKSGDFPLQMVQDAYWTKSSQDTGNDPFGNLFFRRVTPIHGNIDSNQFTFHSHSLPEEGRPANFSGAIGQFSVTGSATPTTVAVGEPVSLHFTVTGEGNFDYVKCPSLATDANWKTYVPASKIEYQDGNHSQGIKTFEQAVIPQKNGNLALPAASFSYFDSTTKQYVTAPIPLPTINVTGSAPALASAASGTDSNSTVISPAAPQSSELVPNRLELGSLHRSLVPVYRQPWFWIVQSGLSLLLLAGVFLFFFHSRFAPDPTQAEQALRTRSLHQQEDAMSDAVRRGDAQTFFLAARNAVQLQLGTRWRIHPEAITLAEIRERDPQLAETLEPLFTQANEVIYSGLASGDLNLAEWELHVRRDLLQPQHA